jgi:hypothetical protein
MYVYTHVPTLSFEYFLLSPPNSLKAEREMLTGGVYGERLVANFGDATQIIGALLEIPGDGACGGAQVYVAAAHWRSTPIQNQAAAEDISHLRDAGCSKAELEAAQRAFSEGTSGRMGEAKTTIEFLKSHKNVILMGDFNATAGAFCGQPPPSKLFVQLIICGLPPSTIP